MRAPTPVIVDRVIQHAQRLAKSGYAWPIARSALAGILADLEKRDPGNPSIERLRQFIAEGDRLSQPGAGRTSNRDPGAAT